MTLKELKAWLDETPKGDHCRTVTFEIGVHQSARTVVYAEEYWIDEEDHLVERPQSSARGRSVGEALKRLRKPRGTK